MLNWLKKIIHNEPYKKPVSEKIHDEKNKYTEEMMQVHAEVKKIEKRVIKLNNKIMKTTAYKVAVSTGRI